jgi:hypothetical protein
LALALGEESAAAAPASSPRLAAVAGRAELARLRVRCGELEGRLEAAVQEREGYKQALRQAMEALVPGVAAEEPRV